MSKIKTIIGEEGWDNQLSSFFNQNKFEIIKEKLQNIKFNPKGSLVFKPFKLCPWEDVKVIIINDYPLDIGNGLAYGLLEETFLVPFETQDIMLSIENAYDQFLLNKFDYSLENLAKQGILLLNLELTTSFDPFNTKPQLWKEFSDLVIDKLNKNKTGLIWVLWSSNVFHIEKQINPKFHHIIKETIKPKHFIEINKIINKQNGKSEEIRWY